MGAYLSQPVTDKEKYQGSSTTLDYGGASMQVQCPSTGFRRQQFTEKRASVKLLRIARQQIQPARCSLTYTSTKPR